jgi:hypothetical protein
LKTAIRVFGREPRPMAAPGRDTRRRPAAVLALALLLALAFGPAMPTASAQDAGELVVIQCAPKDVHWLRKTIAARLGVPVTSIRIGHLLVYSDLPNFGQDTAAGETGPILCVGPGYGKEGLPPGTPFPTETVDIFEQGTSTRTRIAPASPTPDGDAPADVVACEGFGGNETCVRINTP